ncbi:MAG: hypothetical protein WEB53_14155 [Akkermansiaceae bacterium]
MKFRELAVIARLSKMLGMSRRSRRKNATGGSGWLGRATIWVLVLGILGLGIGYAVLRHYLHSDSFRKFLSAEVGEAAGVTGEFAPFRWEGLAVDTDSFEAKGGGPVTRLRADGLHTEVGFGGITRGVWEIRQSNLRRLEVSVDATKKADFENPPVTRKSSTPKPDKSRWLPSEAELQGLEVQEVVVKAILDQGLAVASGMRVRVEPAGAKNAYRGTVEGGTISLPLKIVPEIRLDRLRLRYQDGQVFLTDSTILAWENGRIEATGEWDMKSRQYTLEGGASGLECNDIFSDDWAKRFTGDVSSSFILDNTPGFPKARGSLKIQGGVLTALPMLDALAAYADTRRFRVLNLNDAHTDWRWQAGELALTNLVLSSEGLVRLEGGITIRGRALDGIFRLGLAPGTLASIPGAETDVFIAGERGLLWAPVRITGTLDDPKEDLTDRLIAAAGLRMFDQIPETGEKVVKFTRSVIGEDSNKIIDKGVKIIEENSGLIRDVGGVLDGILGGRARKDEPTEVEKR